MPIEHEELNLELMPQRVAEVTKLGREPYDRSIYPLITIGIPTRNREAFVKNCVASALAQTYPNIEVLVSDNASTDSTVASLRSIDDERLRVVRNSENIGLSKNFDRCVQEAKGDYLVLISDDNILEPTFLAECVQLVRQEPNIPIVVAAYEIVVLDEFSRRDRRTVPAITSKKLSTGIWQGTEILEQYLRGQLSAQLLSSIVRTDILRRDGFSSHPHACDEATWIPILLEGRAGLVNNRRATYFVHGSSHSSKLSVDDRLLDLCAVMDEISALVDKRVSDPAKRAVIQQLTRRYIVHQALISLVLYRRNGASLTDVVQKLRDWRPILSRCTLINLVSALRLRSLGRIILPKPVARWSMALGLDRLI